jgi:hypothetical protein
MMWDGVGMVVVVVAAVGVLVSHLSVFFDGIGWFD